MCSWGDSVGMTLKIPASLSSTGKDKFKTVNVDRCISDLVYALNSVGVFTTASCCGHGKRPGGIILDTGVELIIARNYDEARFIDNLLNESGIYKPIN